MTTSDTPEIIQTPELTSTFTIDITSVKTGNFGNLTDVIKIVTFTVTATKSGQSFTMPPYTVELSDPDPNNFTPFSQVTKQQLINWLETDPRVHPTVMNMRYAAEWNVDKLIAEGSYTEKPLPWN